MAQVSRVLLHTLTSVSGLGRQVPRQTYHMTLRNWTLMGDLTNLEHNNRGVEKKKGTQKTDSSENWCWSVLEALYGGLKLAKSEVNK